MRRKDSYMIQTKIGANKLCICIIMILLALSGCGNKDSVAATEPDTSQVDETVVAQQLSPAMNRYQEAVKQNTILLAQKQHLSLAMQYYDSLEMSRSVERFEQKSFEEEIFGSQEDAEAQSEVLTEYPEFNPDVVEISIPEISEEEAETKAAELETQNEELEKTIADMQDVVNNYKLQVRE